VLAERWQLIQPHVDHALDLKAPDCAAYLAVLAEKDSALADEVRQVLRQIDAAGEEDLLEDRASLAAMTSPQRSLTGQLLGTTLLVAPIADGGMGQVWLGSRTEAGRAQPQQVAVKLLSPHVVNPMHRDRFQRECETLAVLRHPHIAGLIETGVSPWGQPYLVLEHVEGTRIDLGFDQRRLTVRQRVQHFITLVDAVQHAHQHLVVHRDIKPANVMLSTTDQIKLLDFGIAKLLSDAPVDVTVTARANAMLTPGYAAPEQWLGQPVTMATDVYSLGVLLYVLLTGRHPHLREGTTQKQAELATLKAAVPRLSQADFDETVARQRGVGVAQLRLQLRGDLDRIVAKAMHIEMQHRYANAAAFADDLRRFLEHRAVLARPPHFSYLLAKFARRNRLPLAIGTVALAAISIVSTHALQQRAEAQANAQRVDTVNGLLQSMFRGMSPDVAEQRTFTAPELLARAQKHLEQSPGGDASTRRQMRVQLADVYAEVGALEQAISILDKELLEAEAANDLPGQIGARHRLADAYLKRPQTDRAQEHLDALDQLLTKQAEPDAQAQTLALMLRGEVLWHRLQYSEAERQLALAMQRASGLDGIPAAPLDIQARIQHLRGILATAAGSPKTALELLRQANDLNVQRGDLGVTDRLNMVRDVARAEVLLGQFGAASLRLEPALRELDARLGPQHPLAMDTATVLLNSEFRQGHFARCRPLVARLLNSTGPGRDNFVSYANQMDARIKLQSGGAAEAEVFFKGLVAEFPQRFDGPNGFTEPLRRTHGETLLHLGRNAQALEVLQTAHRNQLRLTHPHHRTVAVTGVLLGCVHARLGDLARAQELWQMALEVLLRETGPQDPFALVAQAYALLSSPGGIDSRVLRAQLANRIERELGWQSGAPELARLLRQVSGPIDWSQLPVVL
jgi:eukaryotic-like serine/threonine-protein kinase